MKIISDSEQSYHLPFCLLAFSFITSAVFSDIIQKELQSSTELLLPELRGCSTQMKSILPGHTSEVESQKADEQSSSLQPVPNDSVCPLSPCLSLSCGLRFTEYSLLSVCLSLHGCCFLLTAPQVLSAMFV